MSKMDLIKQVRERSNVSLTLCKKAVEESGGHIEKALYLLQEWGHLKAAEKSSRDAKQGKIFPYIHLGDKLGVLVEINCETDFSANSDEFKEFGEIVAMQIAAMNPKYVSELDVLSSDMEEAKALFKAQIENMEQQPPEKAHEGILKGKFKKWMTEACLMSQKSAMHPDKTMEDLRVELVSKISENVVVKRFTRWELGRYE
jgi:elongation factor Ts